MSDQYHQQGMSGYIEEDPHDATAHEGPKTFFNGRASQVLPSFDSVVTVCFDLTHFLGKAGLAWQFAREIGPALGFSFFLNDQGPQAVDESWLPYGCVNFIQAVADHAWTWKITVFGHEPLEDPGYIQPQWLLQLGTRTPPFGKPHFFDADELKALFVPKLIQVEDFLAKPEYGILSS